MLQTDAEKMYNVLKSATDESPGRPIFVRCELCGEMTSSYRILSCEDSDKTNKEVENLELSSKQKEYPAAFVFFKTRRGAYTASRALQSSNPMYWVTYLAPEPCDVYWTNLCTPYKQLWIRRIMALIVAAACMLLFFFPVALVQTLTDAARLSRNSPFLKKILEW